MFRKLSLIAATAVFLLLPSQLVGGGPPWLILPVEGITSANANACAELLTDKLTNKLSPHGKVAGIQVQPQGKQWYLTFPMGDDVALADVEAALSGSEFSLPRNHLHLFGHVTLEIDAHGTEVKNLLDTLNELGHVSVDEFKQEGDRLFVTIDMPYPIGHHGSIAETLKKDEFRWTDYSSDVSARSDTPVTSRTLPSYETIRAAVITHGASLKGIRWSVNHACRALGAVALQDADRVTSASRTSTRK